MRRAIPAADRRAWYALIGFLLLCFAAGERRHPAGRSHVVSDAAEAATQSAFLDLRAGLDGALCADGGGCVAH